MAVVDNVGGTEAPGTVLVGTGELTEASVEVLLADVIESEELGDDAP